MHNDGSKIIQLKTYLYIICFLSKMFNAQIVFFYPLFSVNNIKTLVECLSSLLFIFFFFGIVYFINLC